VLGAEFDDNKVYIKLYVTSVQNRLQISLLQAGKEVFSEQISSSPESPYIRDLTVDGALIPEKK